MSSSVDLLAVALEKTLKEMPAPVRLLPDAAAAERIAPGAVESAGGQEGGYASVLLVAADVAELRRLVSVLPGVRRFETVGVFVAEADRALSLRPRPVWPTLRALDARLVPTADGYAATTVLRFAERAPSREVLLEVARAAALPTLTGGSGLVVAVAPGQMPPPVDPTVTPADALDETVPPDVIVHGSDVPAVAPSEVTGRTPTLVAADRAMPPIDEAVFNPHGWSPDWDVKELRLGAADLSPGLVTSLRRARLVRIDWSEADPHTVAGLAMTGVPFVSEEVPRAARGALGDVLADLIEAPDDTGDALGREERSIRIRRQALIEHSTVGWRARMAALAGVRMAAYPSVSVLLMPQTPEGLDFAVGQVARLRQTLPGAAIEAVIDPHGFSPDAARVSAVLGSLAHQVLDHTGEAGLVDSLHATAAAASGDLVLPLHDRTWCSPDLITDLLLARRYSGAAVVETPGEMSYTAATTTRRRELSETYCDGIESFALCERGVLRASADVRVSAGQVYRTHGLGTLSPGAHPAFEAEFDAEFDAAAKEGQGTVRWPGFRPSRLLELDEAAP